MKTRRTKEDYKRLFDDPKYLFGNVDVLLFPNGVKEIWIQGSGSKSVCITAGEGPAGMGIRIRRHLGTPMTLTECFAPGTQPDPHIPDHDLAEISLTIYNSDEQSRAFREWYQGRGPHPDDGSTRTARGTQAAAVEAAIPQSV